MRLRVLLNAYSNIVRIGVEKSANREKNIVQKRDIVLHSANQRKLSAIKHFLHPIHPNLH